jgi:hypothetical protein
MFKYGMTCHKGNSEELFFFNFMAQVDWYLGRLFNDIASNQIVYSLE